MRARLSGGTLCACGILSIYLSISTHLSLYMCIYIYMLPPPQRHTFCMISPPKALFRAVFVVHAKHPPIRPDFA